MHDRLQNRSKHWIKNFDDKLRTLWSRKPCPNDHKNLCKFNSSSQTFFVQIDHRFDRAKYFSTGCPKVLFCDEKFDVRHEHSLSILSLEFEFFREKDSNGAHLDDNCKIDRSIESEISRLALLLRSVTRKCVFSCVRHHVSKVHGQSNRCLLKPAHLRDIRWALWCPGEMMLPIRFLARNNC